MFDTQTNLILNELINKMDIVIKQNEEILNILNKQYELG